MADIFISHSSQDRDLTRELADLLETHFGPNSVWWDQAGLRGGDKFSPEITRALDAARAAVVVWTKGAVTSDWVYAEAVRAAAQRKIVTIQASDLDRSLIPLPFNVFHTCLAEDKAAVIAAVEKRLSGEASPLPSTMPGQGFQNFLLDPKQETLPAWAIAKGPASLLLAKYRLVPFDDIHGLRDEFVRWATQAPAHAAGPPVLGRLVYAPAGLGKTRALIEIADELTRTHGWLAGFVPRDIRGAGRELSEGALERLILGGRDAAGLMLVVDYAESRQEDVVWLSDRLVKRAESNAKPARLVLISRGSGVWWRELLLKTQSLQFLCGVGTDAYDEIEIPEEIKRSDRRSLFDASVNAFLPYRNAVSSTAVELRPPSDDFVHALETEGDYDRPLAVQIAALLHVAGVDVAEGRERMAGPLDRILGLEYQHWDKVLKIATKPNWQRAVKNAVGQLTLVGGVQSADAAAALIRLDPFYQDAKDIDVPRVREALSAIFPSDKGALAALEPDLIGEHHVARVATDTLVDSCLDWAGDNREQRQQILTVLNRATRAEHGGEAANAVAQLDRLVKMRAAMLGGDLIKVALETPGQLLDICAKLELYIGGLDDSQLTEIDAALPIQSLALMDLSLAVATRRVDVARLEAATLANVAPALHDAIHNILAARLSVLGIRLSNLGRHEDALAATQEAVDIYRRLTQTRTDTLLPDLATGLNNFGIRLSNVGRREDALAAMQEAVGISRRLAQSRPDTFLPYLASHLRNLAIRLDDFGRYDEALSAAEEAAEITRRLAQERPEAYLPDLASSLNNVGNRLFRLGRNQDGLLATQEAVDIRRRLAQKRPDGFLPDLASSLHNFGNHLSSLGRREDALSATQEAVDIRRRLAQARPDAFLPDLAMSLTNLGDDLSKLGRHKEAVVASREAVEINRCLARTRPDAFRPSLAMSLNNISGMLFNFGFEQDALAAIQEAIDIYRLLAQTLPDAFFPDLARSLDNFGMMLSELGRCEEAVAASQEAAEIRRRVAQT